MPESDGFYWTRWRAALDEDGDWEPAQLVGGDWYRIGDDTVHDPRLVGCGLIEIGPRVILEPRSWADSHCAASCGKDHKDANGRPFVHICLKKKGHIENHSFDCEATTADPDAPLKPARS